jgi:hypothetical protein
MQTYQRVFDSSETVTSESRPKRTSSGLELGRCFDQVSNAVQTALLRPFPCMILGGNNHAGIRTVSGVPQMNNQWVENL